MKRVLTFIAVAALVFACAFCYSAAVHARDYWNGSGASLNHQYFKGLTPYDNDTGRFGEELRPPDADHSDWHTHRCDPVPVHTTTGVVMETPAGCVTRPVVHDDETGK
jgi:hypothetical protein